jgi:hypothetical protein
MGIGKDWFAWTISDALFGQIRGKVYISANRLANASYWVSISVQVAGTVLNTYPCVSFGKESRRTVNHALTCNIICEVILLRRTNRYTCISTIVREQKRLIRALLNTKSRWIISISVVWAKPRANIIDSIVVWIRWTNLNTSVDRIVSKKRRKTCFYTLSCRILSVKIIWAS